MIKKRPTGRRRNYKSIKWKKIALGEAPSSSTQTDSSREQTQSLAYIFGKEKGGKKINFLGLKVKEKKVSLH